MKHDVEVRFDSGATVVFAASRDALLARWPADLSAATHAVIAAASSSDRWCRDSRPFAVRVAADGREEFIFREKLRAPMWWRQACRDWNHAHDGAAKLR